MSNIHSGCIEAVFGFVLQGRKFGNLIELLFADLPLRQYVEQPLHIVRKNLRRHTHTNIHCGRRTNCFNRTLETHRPLYWKSTHCTLETAAHLLLPSLVH